MISWFRTGFPAPDTDVHRFLTNPNSRQDALFRAHAFLASLFIETTTTVSQLSSDNLPDKFRRYMTDNQKMQGHNDNRKAFYRNVVRRATQVSVSFAPYIPYKCSRE